jgi:SHS family lactate transporter-like MFS transporter
MSRLAPFEAGIAEAHGGDFALVLSWTLAAVAVALILVTALGAEARAAELRIAPASAR